MSKWVSRGYAPSDAPEARRAREIEVELLRQYLPLLLENSERIRETPEYFYCQLASAWISSMWFYGGGPIPLGVLLLLWDTGEMNFECPSCGGTLHAIGVAGSILSGSGSAWGVCRSCGRIQTSRQSISRAIHSIGILLPCYRNRPIVERGERPVFDWRDGLKGNHKPDEVLVPAIEPVGLWELICMFADVKNGDHQRTPMPSGCEARGTRHHFFLERKKKTISSVR